jgi:hypothetical protein
LYLALNLLSGLMRVEKLIFPYILAETTVIFMTKGAGGYRRARVVHIRWHYDWAEKIPLY